MSTPTTPTTPTTRTPNSPSTATRSATAHAALFNSLPQMPISKLLSDYITAASSGCRPSLLYLVVAIFTSARATVKCLTAHNESIPYWLAAKNLARLKHCAARLESILYTIRHAPGRFLAPSQLRHLTRVRAILAHIWAQPVDFSPITPFLASRARSWDRGRPRPLPPSTNPQSDLSNSQSAQPAPSDSLQTDNSSSFIVHSSSLPAPSPLLLRYPGRALAHVLIQLGRIYGIRPSPVPHASPLNPQSAIPGPTGPHNPQSSPASSQISNFKSQIADDSSSFIVHRSSFPSSPASFRHHDPG